jgi:subtilisin-like proprotein convertase family protein
MFKSNPARFIKTFSIIIISLSVAILFQNCSGQGFEAINLASSESGDGGSGNTPANGDPSANLLSSNDPLQMYAWHLDNSGQSNFATNSGLVDTDLNLQVTWQSRYYGEGIQILVSDDGVESNHEDLTQNYNRNNVSRDYALSAPFRATASGPRDATDNHGTSVAGLIAARGGNGLGSSGVAPLAKIASANFLSNDVSQSLNSIIDQVSGPMDIVNQSWGLGQEEVDDIYSVASGLSAYAAQLKVSATNLRNGKGVIITKAAGNSFALESSFIPGRIELANANFDLTNTTPYTINVGALSALNRAASYSSPGACIWITSLGGEDGFTNPALLTTDRTGCNAGYSQTALTGDASNFQKGLVASNTNCNYSSNFNGTSAATPLVTGTAALLLQANPSLTWRDIKHILASTAVQVQPNQAPITQHPIFASASLRADYPEYEVPAGYVYEQGWVTNGAGYKYHNWYGFGRVNVDAAFAMARTYAVTLAPQIESNWQDAVTGLNISVPDFTADGASHVMDVERNVKIEAVQLRVNITHPNIGQLALELTSPSGVKSIVVNVNNSLYGLTNYLNPTFLVNTFYGESSVGNWTLKVIDGSTGETGTLNGWSLNFFGTEI